jgi:DNA-binding IclR family transcriptional regulator
MSQADILKVLKKEKRWMSAKEIFEKLDANSSTVSQCLTRLEKGDFVKKKLQKSYVGNRYQ